MYSCSESRGGRPEIMIMTHAVIFDLDDTVLRDDLSISDYTKDVFRRLCSSGVAIIPASGRTRMSMKPFVDQIGCACLIISCNGAEIWDASGHGDNPLFREYLSVDICREIAEFGNRYSCYAQTYSDDRFFFNEHSEYSQRYEAASMLPGEYVGNLAEFIREPRCKILMMADERKIAQMLEAAKKEFENRVSVTCSKSYFLEFNPLQATKGNALKKVSSMLGVPANRFIAFGDSLNDASMLQAAGVSVAVSNARREILEMCGEHCLSNNEDGVAHYLDSLFFERRFE